MSETIKAAQARLIPLFETALKAEVATWRWPAPLGAACEHVLFGGGKRVRPLLAMLGAESVGGSASTALPWAVAIEMVHTYSLAHDDLPAMDDDDLRRGRPTCHIVYDEAVAILAGDALLTEAFGVLARAPHCAPLVGMLAHWAGGAGMVGGQILDIAGVHSLSTLERMQRLKTAALIRSAVVGGALSAGGSPDQLKTLSAYGDALGMLFQITDDILDQEQDAERDGNSYLHHLSMEQVLAERDRQAQVAQTSIAALPHRSGLLTFVERIAYRTV